MRKGYTVALSLLFTVSCWAAPDANGTVGPILNRISLQLHSEQWLTTQTALVSVRVNASVTDQGIEKVRSGVMQKLAEFSSKGDWHIISFDRQQDNSGLESLQIMAQARLPQGDLTNLRSKAKTISVPGESFTIDSIQFTPSEDEIRQANNALRNDLYQQTKNEIDVLNKIYPDQKYFLHKISFASQPAPQPMPMAENTYMAKGRAIAAMSAPALVVGNKAELYASVVISSVHDTP